MTRFRFITLITGILFVACVLGGYDYLSKLGKYKTELASLKAQAATASEAVARYRQEWQTIKQAQDKLDLLTQREEELLKQRDALALKERHLTAEIKHLSDSMTAAVAKARASAIGTMIPELKLPGSAPLYNAKIVKVTDDSILLLHEGGMAKATAKELPPEHLQKYDLGAESIVYGLDKLLK